MARTLSRRRTEAPPAPTAVDDVEPDDAPAPAAPLARARGGAAPARRGRSAPSAATAAPRAKATPGAGPARGWAAAKKMKSADFAENFKPSEEETVVKFLDEEPFAVYRQHWIERSGKKSWPCLESIGDTCSLCEDAGDTPRSVIAFNVLDFSDPNDPQVLVWEAGQRVSTTMNNFASKPKTSPINRADLYFTISRTGKGAQSTTTITPVKERDLVDDYGVQALEEGELMSFSDQAFTEDIIRFPTAEQVREITDEIVGD